MPSNKTAYREVILGAAVEGMRIVASGLEPGERIVVNGLQRVRPGTLIAPQTASMNGKLAQSGASPAPDHAGQR